MRVSEYFSLNRTQGSLDFLDVDIYNDTKLYIDPYAFEIIPSTFSDSCKYYIQNYFDTLLEYIRTDRIKDAKSILEELKEPNETHLGVSAGASRGRGLGPYLASKVLDSLIKSEASSSGLLMHLEETVLLIEGVRHDIISDMVTNIIRAQLIQYTQDMAELYNIPLEKNVASGPMWNPTKKSWYQKHVDLPSTDKGVLILIPKAIVRKKANHDVDEYYNKYVLNFLRAQELKANSGLVHILKNKAKKVYQYELKEKYGSEKKQVSIRETINHPEIIEDYRSDKRTNVSLPLEHEEFSVIENIPNINLHSLFNELQTIPSGTKDADNYEKKIEELISAILYPYLMYPQLQHKIHEGRKRIDITYTNVAKDGFFFWLSTNYPAPHIFIECKNYSVDLKNPEFDQLSGRFSPSRGKFGILICREIKNKELAWKRCIDTAKDDRGFMLFLEDSDFKDLVSRRHSMDYKKSMFNFFKTKFDKLII